MTASIDDLKKLYAAGQLERCWQEAHQTLLAGSNDTWAFLLAAMCLLRLDRRSELAAMIRGSGPNSGLLAAWVFTNLLETEAYAALAPLDALFTADEPLWLIANYFSGCALLMQGKRADAMVRFRAFRLSWRKFAGAIDFMGDDRFNVMLRQGRLVADPAEVARRMTIEARTPDLHFVGTPVPSRSVIFASGNSHYFNAMAGAFIAGTIPLPSASAVDDEGGEAIGLHLHVIDPDAESLALIEKLRTQYGPRLVFSLESPPLFRTYTYYSCSRFYVMGVLLDRYRAPILSFDIDIAPTAPVGRLFEVARPYDFCCFRTRRNEPASIFQASVMYWADNVATRKFLRSLQRFCWEELPSPSRSSWMLDQAALFSLLTDPDSTTAFGDYRQLLNLPLEDIVRIGFSNEIKGKLRLRGESAGSRTP